MKIEREPKRKTECTDASWPSIPANVNKQIESICLAHNGCEKIDVCVRTSFLIIQTFMLVME